MDTILPLLISTIMFTAFVLIFVIVIYASRYKRVPPDKAMIVYGLGRGPNRSDPIIATGGGMFIMPVVQGFDFLPLDMRTLTVNVQDIPVKRGSLRDNVDAEVVAQYRIGDKQESLKKASKMLLHRTDPEIGELVRSSIEKQVRSEFKLRELGSIMRDPDGIAERTRKKAEVDLSQYGIEVRSFVLKGIDPKNRSGQALERRGSLLAVQCPYCHGVYEVET